VFDDTINRLLDFPFVGDSDRLHALGLYMLPFVRPAIAGPTPCHLITAPGAGAGKTYLAECVFHAAYGRLVAPATLSTWTNEAAYQIAAYFAEPLEVLYFDNLKTSTAIGGPDFHRLLTTYGSFKTRRVRSGTASTGDVRCVWVATGNLIDIDQEMERRTVPIALGVRKGGFRTPGLREWILKNRDLVIACLLAMIRKWLDEGRQVPTWTLASFDLWNNVVGGTVCTTGGDGAADSWLAVGHRPVSLESRETMELISNWTTHPDGTFHWQTAAQVLDLHDRLCLSRVGGFNERGKQISMGKWLKSLWKTEEVFAGQRIAMKTISNGPVYRPEPSR
jgi:hypothetical protein